MIAELLYLLVLQSNLFSNSGFVKLIKKQLNIDRNCHNFKNLPDITIHLKARKNYKSKETIITQITLKPEDYIIDGDKIRISESNDDEKGFLNEFEQECEAAFMPIDVPAPRGPILVFGEYFFRKYYTIFDRDETVIGFAVSNHKKVDTKHLNIMTPYEKSASQSDSTNNELNEINNITNISNFMDNLVIDP